MDWSGHFPSFKAISPLVASEACKPNLRGGLRMSWLLDVNAAWASLVGAGNSLIGGAYTLGSQIGCLPSIFPFVSRVQPLHSVAFVP